MQIIIRWDVEPDDTRVRGNALASGDAAADKACEDEILRRIGAGDVWAWAHVSCEARLVWRGETFIGRDGLGGCSYKDLEDFKAGGYYEDMKQRAIDDLKQTIRTAAKRGRAALGAARSSTWDKLTIEEVGP